MIENFSLLNLECKIIEEDEKLHMRIPMMEYQLHSRLPWNLRSFMQTLKCTYETIRGEIQSKDA